MCRARDEGRWEEVRKGLDEEIWDKGRQKNVSPHLRSDSTSSAIEWRYIDLIGGRVKGMTFTLLSPLRWDEESR